MAYCIGWICGANPPPPFAASLCTVAPFRRISIPGVLPGRFYVTVNVAAVRPAASTIVQSLATTPL
jgi:hypothetical protein